MSRIFVSILLLLTALAWPLASASAAVDRAPMTLREPVFSKDALNLLNEAQKMMKAGKIKEALQILNLAHNLEPNNPYVLARLAVALNMAGQYEAALNRVLRARKLGATDDLLLAPLLDAMLSMGQNQNVLDLYPEPGPDKRDYAAGIILRARASALQVLGDRAGATSAMNRSLALLKDYDGIMTAGRIALLQGNFDESDMRADEALKLKPKDLDASLLKIDLAMQRQATASARIMVERLVADNPQSMTAVLARIKVYLASGRADKAESDVNRVLEAKPDMPMALYFRSIILARRGNAKQAWDVAHSLPKEFVQIDPSIALNVANMAIAAGFVDSGATLLNVAVSRFPYLLDVRLRLADIRLRQKSIQHALNTLTPVQDSQDPRVAVLYARIALFKGDAVKARKHIEPLLESGAGDVLRDLDKNFALKSVADYAARHPGDKLAKKQNAILLLSFGEFSKARAAYEQLVRDDPADGLSLNNLAWLVVQSDSARALSLAQAAVKADPKSASYLDTLGTMQMTRSDAKGAVVSLQKAHDLRPDDPGIFYHLALALEADGQGAQSQVMLQDLVKRGGFNEIEAAKELLGHKLKMAGSASAARH